MMACRWTLLFLLAIHAPWRASSFSATTSTSNTPVVPQHNSDSPVVQSLKEQIHELRHEISVLQDDSDDATTTTEFPWKQWYADAEERNRALTTTSTTRPPEVVVITDDNNTVELLETTESVTVELDRLQEDYNALRTTLATVRQHHAENCAQWQASLDGAETQLQQLQQNSVEELTLVQEEAKIELETTVAAFTAELGVLQGELHTTQETLAQRERKLQHRGNRILVLEQEKKSLRMLCKTSVRLVLRRFDQRAERLVQDALRVQQPSGRAHPKGSTTTTPTSYQLQQKQEIQAIRELVAVSNKSPST